MVSPVRAGLLPLLEVLAPRGVQRPGCLDQHDRLVEVISHGMAELEFHARSTPRAVADCQRALALEELDEYVVADNPLAVLAQVREEVFGLGVGGLVVQQFVVGLALHIGLPGQDEHLDLLRRISRK